MASIRDLFIRIIIKDEASETVDKVNKKVDKAKDSMSGFGKAMEGLAGLGVSAAFMGFGKSVLDTGISFERAMSNVQAAAGLPKSDMAALSNEARRLGATTTFSASEAADAMTELAKAGMKQNDILDSTGQVLSLATAGQLGLANATTIAVDTMKQFGLETSDIGMIADVMAKGANSSTISVSDMAETLKYVGTVARQAGSNLHEVAAMTAILGNAGVKGSQAGTSLRSVFQDLMAPASKASQELLKLGVSVLDSQENLRSVPDIMKELNKALDGKGTGKKGKILKDIFGAEPAAAVATLIESAGDKIDPVTGQVVNGLDAMIKAMVDSNGYAEEFAKILNDNIAGDLKTLSSMFEELKLQAFDTIKPMLRIFTQWFSDSEAGMDRLQTVLMVLTPVIGTILAGALYSAATAAWALITPLAPFIAIAFAVGVAITALYLAIEDLWTFAQGGDSLFGDIIQDWFGLSPEQLEEVRVFISSMFKDIVDTFYILVGLAVDFGGHLINIFKNVWPVLKVVLGVFVTMAFIIGWVLVEAVMGLAYYILAAFKWIAFGIDWLVEFATEYGEYFIMALLPITVLYFYWDEITGFIGKAIDWIMEKWLEFASVFSEVWNSVATFFGGDQKEVAVVEKRAKGGPVLSGKSYLVGDGGEPELFTPGASGFITPMSAYNEGAAGGASNTNISNGGLSVGSIVVYANSESVAGDIVEQVKTALDRLAGIYRIEAGV